MASKHDGTVSGMERRIRELEHEVVELREKLERHTVPVELAKVGDRVQVGDEVFEVEARVELEVPTTPILDDGFVITAWDNTHRWFWRNPAHCASDGGEEWTAALTLATSFDNEAEALEVRHALQRKQTSEFIRRGGRDSTVVKKRDVAALLKGDLEVVE